MNSINFLKQAHLADQLGNFRLADKLYKKAARLVTASAFDRALLEALEKAGIKSGERATLESIEALFVRAIESTLKGDSAEFRMLLKEAGISDERSIQNFVEQVERKELNPKYASRFAKALEKKLYESEDSIFKRMIKDVPEPPIKDVPETPIKENPFKKNLNKLKKPKEYWDRFMSKPYAKKLLLAAGISAAVVGGGWYFVKVNGEEASDEEVENALSGSGMYETRMQAGQQQAQNEKAQAYVDANKGKFTSQRDFYNAALGAGDKNFANSVIAIVKKDLDLPIESEKTVNKDSESYLNKSPYGTT
jgi:hypothetical protein